jgi:hypothetical protein
MAAILSALGTEIAATEENHHAEQEKVGERYGWDPAGICVTGLGVQQQ